jgi:hypothetical protein
MRTSAAGGADARPSLATPGGSRALLCRHMPMSLLTASRPGSSARLTLQLYCVEVIHRPSHLRTSRVPITSCLAPCLAPCLARPQRVGRLGHVRRQPPSPLHRPARRTHQSTVLRHTYPGAMSAPMAAGWGLCGLAFIAYHV